MQDFDDIYIEYFNTVYKFLLYLSHNNIELSEDLAQETFYKAIKTIDSFSQKCKLSVWLCQIAKNLYYDYFSKHKKMKQIEYSMSDDYIVNELFEDDLISSMEKNILYERIQKLDDTVKQVIRLRIFGNFSFKEIGTILNKTEVWARVTYYREIEKLKEDFNNGK